MENSIIKIRLNSSVITPFHSDTMWGHICWALRYIYGESELEKFLKNYETLAPPLIISNAFPEGYLPYPILPPLNKEKSKVLINKFWGSDNFVKGISGLKILSKAPYLSKEILKQHADKEISNAILLEILLKDPCICPRIAEYLPHACKKKYDNEGRILCGFISSFKEHCPLELEEYLEEHLRKVRHEQTITYHAKINRLSGTTTERSLFTMEDKFFGCKEFEAYCLIGNSFSFERLRSCLEFINRNGYGKKKSTGKGNISCTVKRDSLDIWPKDTNAFMTLSNYAPKVDDSPVGYYRYLTKYGKLGGHFASSPITFTGNPMPFKYPLIMFEAGSVFQIKGKIMNYGRIISGMHAIKDPDILHYGIAYPLFLKIRWQYD